jgi:hypothetical protein
MLGSELLIFMPPPLAAMEYMEKCCLRVGAGAGVEARRRAAMDRLCLSTGEERVKDMIFDSRRPLEIKVGDGSGVGVGERGGCTTLSYQR